MAGVDKRGAAHPMPLGRRRDPSRDASILDAALDVLADVGAAGLTMDGVAARAGAGKATIYRRWTSKSRLILDAIAHMKRTQVDLDHLPDTGTLRGDLLGLFKPQSIEEAERKLRIMTGLASLLSQDPTLANAANAAVVRPWAEAHLTLMRRAAARGELAASADVETVSQVLPSMAAYRTLVQRIPIDRAFIVSMIDGVIVPALKTGVDKPAGRPTRPTKPAEGHSSPRRTKRRPRAS